MPYLVLTVVPSTKGNKSLCTPERDTSLLAELFLVATLSISSKNTIPFCSTSFKLKERISSSLTIDDFEQILTSTNACLTEQYIALMATEGVTINFQAKGIRKMAEIAYSVNEKTENIGARRLHTIMERVLEDISFAPEEFAPIVKINDKFVENKLSAIAKSEDLSRYVL